MCGGVTCGGWTCGGVITGSLLSWSFKKSLNTIKNFSGETAASSAARPHSATEQGPPSSVACKHKQVRGPKHTPQCRRWLRVPCVALVLFRCCVFVTNLLDRVRSRGHFVPIRSCFQLRGFDASRALAAREIRREHGDGSLQVRRVHAHVQTSVAVTPRNIIGPQ